uniref:Nedd4 family interacting protein 1 n=1 Tax=Bos indicus x Bos taurus TaxID=30522 RepID=A0A4W2DDL9_BOBOX
PATCFGRNRLRRLSLGERNDGRSPRLAAAPPGEAGPDGPGCASRGRGGGAASSSLSPPPPQGPRLSLSGGGGAHYPRRAAGLVAAAATETHPRRVSVGLPTPPGRSARAPSARSLALLPCSRLRHGVGVGGSGGGGASLRQPVPAAYFDYKDESGFPKPPSYNVATTLPSYDEAERTKAEATIPLVPGRDEEFAGREEFDDPDQMRIGNDGIFMLTFFMAFLFNWIGFFLSFCLTTSAAGRYGAISGFGLSLIKWILIVRFSTYFPGYFDGQYWLWWVFLVLDVFWRRPSCIYEFSPKKQENTCRK